MFHVHDGYRRTFKIPARAFNSLAKFCNNLTSGFGIRIRRPNEPTHSNPVVVELSTKDLADAGYAQVPARSNFETDAAFAEVAPKKVVERDSSKETDAQKIARIGTSPLAARADHVHTMDEIKISTLPNHSHPKKDLTDFDDNVKALIPKCYQTNPVAYTAANDDAILCLIGGNVAYGKLDISSVAEKAVNEKVPPAVDQYLEELFGGQDDVISNAIYSNVERLINDYLSDPETEEEFHDSIDTAISGVLDSIATEATRNAINELLESGEYDAEMESAILDVLESGNADEVILGALKSAAEEVAHEAMEDAIGDYDVQISDAIEAAIDVGAESAVMAEIGRLYPNGLKAPITSEIQSSVSNAVGGYVTTSRIIASLDANAQGFINSYTRDNPTAISEALSVAADNSVDTYTVRHDGAIEDALSGAADRAVSNYASGQYIIDELDEAIDEAVETAMESAAVSSKVDDAIAAELGTCNIPDRIDAAIEVAVAAELENADLSDFVDGVTVTNLAVYQLYKPSGTTSHYWAVPITLNFQNGLLVSATAGGAFDLYGSNSPNVPTIS